VATPGYNKSYGRTNAATDTTIGKPIFEKKTETTKETFKPGDRVKHHSFGEGEILSARQMGADVLYEVMFDKVGTKRLMATYARLQKI
jgi:DNA helicase-2/ATP-dependent DNA helicase PcrA